MTQFEFEDRTMVEVNAKEFDAINEVYMNSDLDKDEFCKMWIKMNKSRVDASLKARRAAEQETENKERAFNLYSRLLDTKEEYSLAATILSDKERDFVEGLGIEMQEWSAWSGCKMFKSSLTVGYELGKYCGAIR